MSLLNYSVPSPFYGTPNPSTNYYQPAQPSLSPLPPHVPAYQYPHPDKPFVEEEFPPPQYRGHQTTPQNTPTPPPHNYGYATGTQKDNGRSTTKVQQNTYNAGREVDYDYEEDTSYLTPVTPIQGPIFVKNGSVPVVPLYSYPVLNNGTLVQIP
ncbi:hypothetical protein HHI36_014593, partial [Cryptolaemus montrouzieri]